jgi:hypothetical protein
VLGFYLPVEASCECTHGMDIMAMTSVYDGRRCIGFIISRGPKGFEAYTANEISFGIFPTQQEAADAISAAARL